MSKFFTKILAISLATAMIFTAMNTDVYGEITEKTETAIPPNTYRGGVGNKAESIHEKKVGIDNNRVASLPERYVPDISRMPDIRNQNPYGTCWAFSTIAIAELSVLSQENRLVDLSELQLAYFCYNSQLDPLGGTVGDKNIGNESSDFLMQGGNLEYSMESLANWQGAVSEADMPYERADEYYNGADMPVEYAYDKDVVHLRNAYKILFSDKEDVKAAIQKYGAISESYMDSSSYYNWDTNSYYCDKEYQTNHAITIVGWDDGFSRTNFSTTPAGDGAWLVRNSWGWQGYSRYGYFWISYYDRSFDDTAYAFDCVSDDSDEFYDNNYHYDGSFHNYGIVGYQYYGDGTPKLTAANVFTTKGAGEQLKAISFETESVCVDYKVSIYKNLTNEADPESGTLVSTAKGKTTYEGIYTVKLDNSVDLVAGDTFSVVIDFEKDSGRLVIAREGNIEYWINCKASANSGESFIKNNGEWSDYGESSKANIRIKAFTNITNKDVVGIEGININSDKTIEMNIGDKKKLDLLYTPSNTTERKAVWESSNEDVASVISGVIEARGVGEAVITVRSAVSDYSDSITVKVCKGIEYISFNQDWYELEYDGECDLSVDILPSDATERPDIYIKDESVAVIEGNKIKAVGVGYTEIVAKTSKYTYTSWISVDFPKDMNIKAERNKDGTIEISWNEVRNITDITIQQRGLYNYNGQIYTIDDGNVTSFLDERPGDTLRYSIIFSVVTDSGAGSNSCDTDIIVPVDCKVTSVSKNEDNGIEVKWTPSESAQKYIIYRKVDNGEFEKCYTIHCSIYNTGNNTTYIDWNIRPGHTYTYTVQACIDDEVYSNMDMTGMSYTEKEVDPEPARIELANCKIELSYDSIVYSGKQNRPIVKLTYNGEVVNNTEYTVKYSNNTDVGTAIVTVTADPESKSYQGKKTAIFTIVPKAAQTLKIVNASKGLTISWSRNSTAEGYYIYRSKNNESFKKIATIYSNKTVSYTDNSATTNGARYRYYIVTYNGRIKSSRSTIIKTYKLSTVRLSSVANKKTKRLEVKWNKNNKATGYQLQYSKKSNFSSGNKTVKINSVNILNRNIDKLTKGSKYYVRVRAFKKDGSTYYYSNWSDKKSATIKK